MSFYHIALSGIMQFHFMTWLPSFENGLQTISLHSVASVSNTMVEKRHLNATRSLVHSVHQNNKHNTLPPLPQNANSLVTRLFQLSRSDCNSKLPGCHFPLSWLHLSTYLKFRLQSASSFSHFLLTSFLAAI